MKYLILGDLHMRSKTPRCRTETDFSQLCIDKLTQVLDIANGQNVDAILQPGDFFDRPQPTGSLVVGLLEQLETYQDTHPRGSLYAIHGQHDLIHHNEKSAEGSELRKMEAVGLLQLARPEGFYPDGVVGSNYGHLIPKPPFEKYNILLTHAMVGDKPLWPGHELTQPESFMDKHPGFNLYVFGDYHYPYSVQHSNGSWAINAGCLIRLTSSERDMAHRPKVVIFDTETNMPEDVYLDVSPVCDSFDLSKKTVVKDNAHLRELMETLKKGKEIGVDFTANLVQYISDNDVSDEVREILMNELKDQRE